MAHRRCARREHHRDGWAHWVRWAAWRGEDRLGSDFRGMLEPVGRKRAEAAWNDGALDHLQPIHRGCDYLRLIVVRSMVVVSSPDRLSRTGHAILEEDDEL